MSEINLKSLIEEQRKRRPTLKKYNGVMTVHYEYPDMNAYYNWVEVTKRYLRSHYSKDCNVVKFEELSEKTLMGRQQDKMLAVLEALIQIPEKLENATMGTGVDNNINITTNINSRNEQSQNQQQSVGIHTFLEAIKDDLTGRQIKELKEVVADSDNDLEKVRPNILAKLKSFGLDVTSNIVANLLTNPAIWGGL